MSKIQKNDNFYLIDGSGYIFRAYYALPPLTRKSDGLPTGAVSGFCNMLFKLLEDSKSENNENKPTHFAVIFDSARKNFRNEIYSEYKANRSDAPEDLIPQFDYIRKSVEAFNLPSIELINYEADDLIATYSEQIIKEGANVTIVSSDKDLMQLYNKKVKIYDPIKSKYISEEDILKKFGVTSDKIIDVQSLAGDSSDNVPGVPGIGIKTAAELINQYGNLERLLENKEKIKQNKRRETLINNTQKAIISKKLVTLKKDVPVKVSLERFKLKEMNKKKLYDFLREMDFNRLLSSAIATYGQINFQTKYPLNVEKTQNKISSKNYFLVKDEKNLKSLLEKAVSIGEICVDTETDSLDPHQAKLVGISFSFRIGEAYYVPLNHNYPKNLDEIKVLKIFKPVLEDNSIKVIGQNIKFDYIILHHRGIYLNNIEDTMLMSYVLDAGNNRHNMDTLSEIHLNHKTISYKDLVGTGKKQITFNQVDIETAKNYSAEDADVTLRLYKKLLLNLKNEKLMNIYDTFEKPLIKILANMEINGIKLDKKFLNKLSTKFSKRIIGLEKNIYTLSKKKFNIGSTKQLGEILYNELKISVIKKTRKGSFATGASVLEDLAFKGHKLPKLVLEWRQLTKLKNTYSDSLPGYLNPNTGRVHTSFLLAATSTGRLASSDPNLQNIPIKSDDGKDIRKAFISSENSLLLSADYNQIEMRILADLADVKELKKAFNNNDDIHTITASQVFNKDFKNVTSELRRKAKAINFGIIYGISQYGLAKQISVSTSDANDFLKSYFKKFPEIKDYMSSTINFCRKSGYVNNIFGRRTHITGINDKNFNVRNFQERAAINAPIQGSASEIMRMAMINIFEKIKSEKYRNCRILLQIHDELIFEAKSKNIESVKKLVETEMKSVQQSKLHSFSIPILVDINIGENWGLLH